MDYTQQLNEFVQPKGERFVDPEKVAAVEIWGLEKAIEIYDQYNGKLPWSIRVNLQKYSLTSHLIGY